MPYSFYGPLSVISLGPADSGIRLVSSKNNALTINIANATQSEYTITLPASAPAATGQTLVADTDGSLTWGSGFDPTNVITLTNTTAVPATANATAALTASLKVGGDTVLGSTNGKLFFTQSGAAAPTLGSRSNGSKVILFPAISGTLSDHAIGIESNFTWYSVPESAATNGWKWYGGATQVMSLTGTGNLSLSSALNQPLTNMIRNTNAGSSSTTLLGLINDTGSGLVAFTNSSTRTSDGPANSAIIRNDAGDLYLLGKGGLSNTSGIRIAATTGAVTIPNSLTIGTTSLTSNPALSPTSGQYLNIASSTFTDSATVASGTAVAFNAISIAPVTLAATSPAVTTTDASTLYIAGPPVAGTNQTLRNAYALNVGSGTSTFATVSLGDAAIVDSLGANEKDLIYPPTGNAILTGTTTLLNNLPYGNGSYYIGVSSVANAGFPAWNGFIDRSVSNGWSSALRYNATTGAYQSSRSTSDVVTGTSYFGEVIEVQLPVPKNVSQVVVYPRIGQPGMAPKTFVIMGSNTGNTAYKVVYSQTTGVTWVESTGQIFTLTTPGIYRFIRIVALSISSGASDGYVQFTFSLRASNPTLTMTNTTTVAAGANSPLYGALNVSGDVVLAPTNPKLFFPTSTLSAPAFASRASGARIVLSPGISATQADHAIGVDTNAVWYGTQGIADAHKWYAGATNTMSLSGAGNLTVSGTVTSANSILAGTVVLNATTFVPQGAYVHWNRGSVTVTGSVPAYTGQTSFLNNIGSGTNGGWEWVGASSGAGTLSTCMYLSQTSQTLYSYSHIPITDNTATLGATGYRWTAVYATNGTIQTSDIRLKQNVEPLAQNLGLDFVNKLNVISYEMKPEATKRSESKPQRHMGLSAQDVQTALEDTCLAGNWAGIVENEDKMLMMNYSEFVAPLCRAVQEMSSAMRLMTLRIAALETSLGQSPGWPEP